MYNHILVKGGTVCYPQKTNVSRVLCLGQGKFNTPPESKNKSSDTSNFESVENPDKENRG